MKVFVVLICLIAIPPVMLQAVENRSTSLLLDVSKSIPPRDFEKAKVVINEIANTSNGSDTTAVYLFGSKIEMIDRAPLTAVQPAEANSAIYDSAFEAAKDLSALSSGLKTIVIFSDGYDTSSVITLEDLVAFAKKEGIVIDAVGLGRSNRKVLERIAKLTGGAYFHAGENDVADQIRNHVSPFASAVRQEAPAKPVEPPAKPPGSSRPTTQQPVDSSNAKPSFARYSTAGIIAAVLALIAVLAIAKAVRAKKRRCPSCGKTLEPSETVCTDCVSETKQTKELPFASSADSTQSLNESMEEGAPMVRSWPELSQQTQEIMTQTHLLVDKPVLIVKKGKHRGKSYTLDEEHPVSIGRSRVNEIRLEDEATSAQHCRIIPENGHFVIYDLDSTNGTYVGDSKITRAPLNHGDTIKVGDTHLVYKIKHTRQ
jgi:hypothetical protein